MTYFELFSIPVQLKVDTKKLMPFFIQLSRQFHPDYFAGASEEEQAESLQKSALLNSAWKTFQSPDETLKYVLSLKGLLETDEKYQLDPSFLMEVMELNEKIMEGDESPASLEEQLNALYGSIYENVASTIENYQEGVTSEKELLQAKEYYYQKKYLDRIKSGLQN